MVKYYAQIDEQQICIGVSQLSGEVVAADMVELDSYDINVLGKLWQGGKWVDNPNPPMPEPVPPPVTNEELKDLMLDAMQGTTDLYMAQEENKQLQLDIMQGITDLYMMQASATDNTQGGM